MIFNPLSEDDAYALQTARDLAIQLMQAAPQFIPSDLQRAYDDVVENHPDHGSFQIALGVAFGDVIRSEIDYEWISVSDQYGKENALSPRDVNVACFPISMIQKRLTSRAKVTILDLVVETIKSVEEMRQSEDYDKT